MPQADTTEKPDIKTEQRKAKSLIKRIINLGHRRLAGSDTERRTHELLDKEFQKVGLETELIPFWTNQSLYQTLTLHFGLGLGGSVLVFYGHPFLALLLHLTAGLSYFLDSSKKRFFLRRALPVAASQNLIARKAKENPALRIVLMAHADAAFTGKLFQPEMIKAAVKRQYPPGLGFLRKGLLTATASLFVLAFLDLIILLGGSSWFWYLLVILASIPTTVATILNAQVVYRNQVVPGASDNLSGCAALLTLVERLQDLETQENLEIDYVVTGSEEAGVCGAVALRKKMRHKWPRTNTVVIAVDTLSGGDLVILNDGEVVPITLPQWLISVAKEAAEQTESLGNIDVYDVPSGASDAAPFLYDNYDGLGIGAIDPEIGAPRHYHLPSDNLDNLDMDAFSRAVDFLEHFVRALAAKRLGKN